MSSKVLDYNGARVMDIYEQNKTEAKFESERQATINVISQSAFASNNAVNVGMAENYNVLCPMLAQPSTEQIYTTQPEWDFDEGVSLQLGSTATINNVVYPIPSLIYDNSTTPASHVVFPVWMWDVTTGKFGFKPLTITYRHNASYLGGGLDGFLWIKLVTTSIAISSGVVTIATGTDVAVGTWVKLTDSDSNIYYGYVMSRVSDGASTPTYTVTLQSVSSIEDSITISKIELYKPLMV